MKLKKVMLDTLYVSGFVYAMLVLGYLTIITTTCIVHAARFLWRAI